MKKVLLCCALAMGTAVAFSSCAKESCYECTITNLSITSTVDVCDGQVTTTTAGVSQSVSLGSTSTEDYKTNLEATGYTCTTK